MFRINETGETFENVRSFHNRVRAIYKPRYGAGYVKEFYKLQHGLQDDPACGFCGKGAKFVSYNDGFLNHCGARECWKKKSKASNHARGLRQQALNRPESRYLSEHGLQVAPQCPYCNIRTRRFKSFNQGYFDSCCEGECGHRAKCDAANKKLDASRMHEIEGLGERGSLPDVLRGLGNNSTSRRFLEENRDAIMELPLHVLLLTCDSFITRKFLVKNHPNFRLFVAGGRTKRIVNTGRFTTLPKHGDVMMYTMDNKNFYPSTVDTSNEEEFLQYINDCNLFMICERCGCEDRSPRFRKSFDENGDLIYDMQGKFCGDCYKSLGRDRIDCYPKIKEGARRSSNKVKEKIMTGEFTPNRRCYAIGRLKAFGKTFRSSWEVLYYAHCLQSGIVVEYEKIRIPYHDPVSGENRSYIIDFYHSDDGRLVEIKPTSEMMDGTNLAKFDAASNFAKERGLLFDVLSEVDLVKVATLSLLDLIRYNSDPKVVSLIENAFYRKEVVRDVDI